MDRELTDVQILELSVLCADLDRATLDGPAAAIRAATVALLKYVHAEALRVTEYYAALAALPAEFAAAKGACWAATFPRLQPPGSLAHEWLVEAGVLPPRAPL